VENYPRDHLIKALRRAGGLIGKMCDEEYQRTHQIGWRDSDRADWLYVAKLMQYMANRLQEQEAQAQGKGEFPPARGR
jgi:hypothetical protein